MTHSTPALRTSLKCGQALRLHLDCRTTLVVEKGAITLSAPPLWLGERMLAGQTRVLEGQAFRPSLDGWTEIVAAGEVPVELVRYREAGVTLATRCRWMAAALSQRMRVFRGVS
ncbi:hypothetical protein ACSFA3_17345 [Variovorax sp. RHLX14]|uniref:hypothetical protein n=1 Tax=Variovorax sp. RHLX14 TaxID=1259731 RepID=UPI003F456748